jgi:hypothetical protein
MVTAIPPLSRCVELGDDEAVRQAGLVELLGLLEGVGAGGIDDEEGEVRRSFVLLGDGAADLASSSIRLCRVCGCGRRCRR